MPSPDIVPPEPGVAERSPPRGARKHVTVVSAGSILGRSEDPEECEPMNLARSICLSNLFFNLAVRFFGETCVGCFDQKPVFLFAPDLEFEAYIFCMGWHRFQSPSH